MDVLKMNPGLVKCFEFLCQKRLDVILSDMLENDGAYKKLCQERADISMELKALLVDKQADALYEKYSEAVFAQEVYEIAAMYRQGFHDAVEVFHECKLIL